MICEDENSIKILMMETQWCGRSFLPTIVSEHDFTLLCDHLRHSPHKYLSHHWKNYCGYANQFSVSDIILARIFRVFHWIIIKWQWTWTLFFSQWWVTMIKKMMQWYNALMIMEKGLKPSSQNIFSRLKLKANPFSTHSLVQWS